MTKEIIHIEICKSEYIDGAYNIRIGNIKMGNLKDGDWTEYHP